MSTEPLTIMQHWHQETGTYTYTVESWPREIMVEDSILKYAPSDLLTVDGDDMTITVENGRAVYHLDRESSSLVHLGYPAYLVSSRLSE